MLLRGWKEGPMQTPALGFCVMQINNCFRAAAIESALYFCSLFEGQEEGVLSGQKLRPRALWHARS